MPSVSCFFFYVSKNHHAEIGQILRLGTFLAFAGREGDFFSGYGKYLLVYGNAK
jgi:hypothetical protein